MGNEGLFITLEGVDGCGKSTQGALLASAFETQGREVVRLRDPGSARLSEKLRLMLLDPGNDDMCDECELLLYEAARAQMVRELVEPALARGAVVVCDRFYDSTFAYQATGRGLSAETVAAANRIGSCGVDPDATLVFDLAAEEALARATHEGADRLEGEGMRYQRRVRDCYIQFAKDNPTRVRVVDAVGTVEVVHARVVTALADVATF